MLRHHPQPSGQGLKQDRHQIGHQKHPDQRVAEPGTSLQIRRPVARVHVADAHQVGRPQEGEKPAQLLPLSPRGWNVDRPVDLLQGLSFRTRLHHHRHACPSQLEMPGEPASFSFPILVHYKLYIIVRFPASGESNKQKLFFDAPKTRGNRQRVLISMPTGNGSAARMKIRVVRSDRELAGQQR